MGRIYVVQTASVAVANGATVTLAQILAAATFDLRILEISVSIDGAAATEAKGVLQAGHTTASGTLTAYTPRKFDLREQAAAFTAGHTATVEPTYSSLTFEEFVHNQGGYTWRPPGDLRVQAALGFAVKFTNNHTASRNCKCRIVVEE